MATQDDVRRIAASLPGAVASEDHFAFSVMVKGRAKGFAWSWNERIHPKKPKVANPNVLAVSVPNLNAKDLFLSTDPDKYFTEPHYNGYPAILVRLEAVEPAELEDLLVEAWRCKAPPDLLREFDAQISPTS